MSNNAFDVWHAATCILLDARDHLPIDTFNKLSGYIRSRSVEKLCGFEVDMHSSQSDYIAITSIQALFSKNRDFSEETRCFETAKHRFFEGELNCKIANKRLGYYSERLERCKFSHEILLMRDYIHTLIGSPKECLDSMPRYLRFTSGATENSSRAQSQPFRKIRKVMSCTPGAVELVRAACLFTGAISDLGDLKIAESGRSGLRVTDFNRVVLVPKNYKTHRTIAAEPAMNLPFQLAIDSFLKTKLRKDGCDLSDQTRNKNMARSASIHGKHATIDLSMASDTMSIGAVKLLFSRSWVSLLARLRAPFYKGPFGVGKYEKFSSMGNGYTFTLETLMFKAACVAVGSKDHSVYGDDIIIESDLAPALIALLRFLGFRTNEDKTFLTGNFRESCGGDYLNGVDVRPFFVKKSTNLGKMELSHVINGLVRSSRPSGHVWSYCRNLTRLNRLRIVPASEATGSGVHIDCASAVSYGSLRNRSWIPRFRGYVETHVSCGPAVSGNSGSSNVPSKKLRVKSYIFHWCKLSLVREPSVVSHHASLRDFALSFQEELGLPTESIVYRKVTTDWLVFNPLKTEPLYLHSWAEFLRIL